MNIFHVIAFVLMFSNVANSKPLKISGESQEKFDESFELMGKEALELGVNLEFGVGAIAIMVKNLLDPYKGLAGKVMVQIVAAGVPAKAIARLNSSKDGDVKLEDEQPNADDQLKAAKKCLEEKVLFSNPVSVDVEYSAYNTNYDVNVTNNLSWAIGGLYVGFEITSDGRSVPWLTDDVVQSVAGGIEPNETKTIRIRGDVPKEAGDKLNIEFWIIDVADYKKQLLLGGTTILGWPEEKTKNTCEN